MNTQTQASFGAMLKAHRLAAGLTQEALAARAGVSRRGIQALERNESAPQRYTLQCLIAALDLAAEEQARILAAAPPARRRPHAGTLPAVQRTPSLPLPLTPLHGRARELAMLADLPRRADTRLLTLCGAGGIGKTRLALAVAADLHDYFADGVWLVELAPLHDPALVPRTVAAALGLSEQPATPLPATLSAHLRPRHALLLLDNCEHLIASCARLVAALLRECPRLYILATSREPLGLDGERTFAVPPLAVPPASTALPTPAELRRYGAVALFAERAAAVAPSFALNSANAAAVVALTRRLDGLPLALELAAARASVLSVGQIAARLDDRFRLLTGGHRDAPARHQTLRAALDWSYALLTPGEQALLRRLSVCAGGCTLAAVEAVGAPPGMEEAEILDLLAGLARKSLLHMDEEAGEARYRLLETVRQYAAEQLAAGRDEEAAVRDRHLAWCLALMEDVAPRLRGPGPGPWLEIVEREHDNLRAALRWAFTSEEEPRPPAASTLPRVLEGQPTPPWADAVTAQAALGRADLSRQRRPLALRTWPRHILGRGRPRAEQSAAERRLAGLRLATALWRFWYTRGYASEGRAWLEAALRHAAGADRALRASAFKGAGNLAFLQRDYAHAQSLLRESLSLYQALEDRRRCADVLANLGLVARNQGDYARARALLEESLALRRALGDTRGMASALTNLGLVAQNEGDLPRAAALLGASLDLTRQLGDTTVMAYTLLNLGEVAFDQGDYARAQALYEESLAAQRATGTMWTTAGTLINLGAVAHARGDDARAWSLLQEGLALEQALVSTQATAEALELLAAIAVGQNRPTRAAQLMGAAAAVRAALGAPPLPGRQPTYEDTVATVRAALGAPEYAAAWAAGQVMTVEQAIALALSSTSAPHR